MAHDGNSGLDHGLNFIEYPRTAFHLHGFGAAFLDKTSCIPDRFFFRDTHKYREECFLSCIDLLDESEMVDSLLIDAFVGVRASGDVRREA